MKEKCEILSLDLWDTIIMRNCHPNEIKAMTAEYLYVHYKDKLVNTKESVYSLTKGRMECEVLLGEMAKSKGLDDEYFIRDVFELWLSKKIYIEKEHKNIVIDELYNVELNNELKHSFLNPEIADIINMHSYKKLVYISDFYAGEQFINKILTKNKFPFKFDYGFVSCECGYNKRTGNLFDFVAGKLGINFSQQIHIGDNKLSDVKIPQKKGIRCVYYFCNNKTSRSNWRIYKKKQVSLFDFPKICQCTLSPFFYGFISWIAEQCLEKKVRKIYFFTREGEFYYKLYNIIRKTNVYQGMLPESDILEVSRISTFLPSLDKCTINEMMRLWNQYSCQTMEAFFKSLDLPYNVGCKFLECHHIDGKQSINRPWTNNLIQELFNDKEFINFVEQHANNKKSLIMAYLKEKGIRNNRKIAVVDIGWRGTIQDNLCYIYKDTQWLGLYMGLIPFLNKQPRNAEKIGYLNNYTKSDRLLNIFAPYEMICNSPNGSVYGYEKIDGKIEVIRKNDNLEDAIYYSYTKKIQEQVMDDVEQLCRWAKKNYVLSWQFNQIAYNSIEKFVFCPTKKCAKAFFKLNHNEEFGMGEYFNKDVPNKWLSFILAIFNSGKRTEMKKFLGSTTWPQGYFVKFHLYPFLLLYNWKIKSKF